MNRLSRFCESIIEASWLMAIIVTALAINGYTERTFEPLKVLPMRSIVWIGLAAWIMKLVAQGGLQFKRVPRPAAWKDYFKFPLALPVAGWFVAILLSLAFSIVFTLSLYGAYYRLAGAITEVTYILFFLLVVVHLRRREQFERIIISLALSSLLVSIYAIIQRMGLDPYTWTTVDVSQRASSTIGHPIFAAAYMAMILFLLAAKIILAIQDVRANRVARQADIIRVVLYSVVAVLNLIAIWFASSRGPLLGLMAGLAIFALFLFLYWKMKRAVQGALALGAIGILFLALLNIPGGPLAGIRDASWVGPLGHIFEAESGTGEVRTLVWDDMARLTMPHDPIQFPNGEPDRWNLIRPLIGYGPDTMSSTFEGYYNPQIYIIELFNALFDRAHNNFWDSLAFYGIFGTFAKYSIYLSLFFYILDWLGWLTSSSEKGLYWILTASGALLGALLTGLWMGVGFIGIGLPAGALIGLVGIFLRRVFRPVDVNAPSPTHAILLIAFLSAIISNYIELLFGIAVVNTNLLFWLYCAGSVSIGLTPFAIEGEKRAVETAKARRGRSPLVVQDETQQLLVAGSLLWVFVTLIGYWVIYEQQIGASIGETITNALTNIPLDPPVASAGILWMVLVFLVVAPLLFQAESDSQANRATRIPSILLLTGATLLMMIVMWSLRASQMISIMQLQRAGDILRMSDTILGTYAFLYVFIFVAMLLTAFVISGPMPPQTDSKDAKGALAIGVYILAPILALFLSAHLNVRPVYADVLVAFSRSEIYASRPENSMTLFNRGLDLDPTENVHLLRSYDVYINAAFMTASDAAREQLFQTGVRYLQAAYELQPLYINNSISLAYYYQAWGEASPNAELRAARLATAESYFKYAMQVKPTRVDYLLEWARLSLALDDLAGAEQKVASALSINPGYEPTYAMAGTIYIEKADRSTDAQERASLLEQALQYFEQDLSMLVGQREKQGPAVLGIARVYARQEKYEDAKNYFQQALGLGVQDLTWIAYAELADVFKALNDPASQKYYLEQAIAIAPIAEVPALQAELDALSP